MVYSQVFESTINELKSESRYRTFIELERRKGRHPHAIWKSADGPKEVIIWCSVDYLGIGQNPQIIKVLSGAIRVGGTRNISGTSA